MNFNTIQVLIFALCVQVFCIGLCTPIPQLFGGFNRNGFGGPGFGNGFGLPGFGGLGGSGFGGPGFGGPGFGGPGFGGPGFGGRGFGGSGFGGSGFAPGIRPLREVDVVQTVGGPVLIRNDPILVADDDDFLDYQ